ncbi:MAG TPA: hypothetical protein VEM57_10010 [Candidatus Binatus sp.]|nr:hypothetical protein [Candidatus Binatus sp.]
MPSGDRDRLDHPLRRPSGAAPAVRLGVTGTGSTLVVLSWSAAELARERAAGVRLLGGLGVRAGMRVANTLPGALATPGSLLLGDVIEELGALDVPLGAVDGEAARAAWELFDRVQPDVVVLGDAAFLAAAPPASRPWWRGIVRLRSGTAAVETSVPAAAGFTGWQRTWLAVPEATSFVAGTCAASRFHVDERVLAEVLDPRTGEVLATGREGTLALTPLDLDTPPARYVSALAARIAPAPCPCVRSGVTLEVP